MTETTPAKHVISKEERLMKNRQKRRMAWISLASLITIGGKVLFFPNDPATLAAAGAILSALILGFVAIIGSYMGFSTLGSIKGK